MKKHKNIDEYIVSFPEPTIKKLRELRKAIREAAPQASEKISYNMPCFYLNGNLVYFGAFPDHISFFPTASGISAFKKEISKYDFAKGTVRFPIDKPLPIDLIKKIVKFRVKENLK